MPRRKVVPVAPHHAADQALERGYAKGQKTRRRIVEAATPLFASGGFKGTTYEQIASAGGMTKGAVSGHFKRKRDLYIVCVKHGLAFFRDLGEMGAELPPEEGLKHFLERLGVHLSANSDARSFLIQLMREVDNDIRLEIIKTLLQEPFARIRKHISGINPAIDSTAYAFIIFSSLLLDADQHNFYRLMADDKGRSHDMSSVIRRLLGIVKTAREP